MRGILWGIWLLLTFLFLYLLFDCDTKAEVQHSEDRANTSQIDGTTLESNRDTIGMSDLVENDQVKLVDPKEVEEDVFLELAYIQFHPNQAQMNITKKLGLYLSTLSSKLTDPSSSIMLIGHRDATTDTEVDIDSERSAFIKQLLVSRYAIPASRIQVSNYGTKVPKTEERSEQAYAQNRRVELILKEKK